VTAMMNLPANVQFARLPTSYEAAKTALSNCASIDEVKDWADKAESLATYARMADDDTLRKLADRIQARAVRRCGELLRQLDARGGDQSKKEGAHHFGRYDAGHGAGMSDHQIKTAVRVSNVPVAEFEAAVESDNPPTVTTLADQGRMRREMPAMPEGFSRATALIGTVRRFSDFCKENSPEFVAGGVLPGEARELRDMVSLIDGWLDRFVVNMKEPV